MAANPVNAINYSDAIRDTLLSLDLGFPAANAPVDQYAQRYFMWKEAERVVKEQLETTRDALLTETPIPQRKGNHLVHDSRYTSVNVNVVNGPRTLDTKALQSALVKQFNLSMDDAEAFIDACRKEAGLQNRLTVQVKR